MLVFIGSAFLILAAITLVSGTIGVIRFQSAYTKIHPAGLIDSCGLLISILGLVCFQSDWFDIIKLLFIAFLFLVLAPVSTHSILNCRDK